MSSVFVDYVNLVHTHRRLDAPAVLAFRHMHEHDEKFLRRADAFDQLWEMDESVPTA